MKLSDKTITILKNFANINESLMFRKGTLQSTVDVNDHVAAEAQTEEFPRGFAIYNLNQFIANITTITNADLTFNEDSVTISDGTLSMNYEYSAPNMITQDDVALPTIDSPDVEFDLNQDLYQKILKLATLNDLPVLSFIGKDGQLKCVAENLEMKNATKASFNIGEYTGKDFKASFNLDYLNIIPGNYHVKINQDEFGIFESPSVTYLIAVEIQNKKGSK